MPTARPPDTARDLAFILADSGAGALIAHPDLRENVAAAEGLGFDAIRYTGPGDLRMMLTQRRLSI